MTTTEMVRQMAHLKQIQISDNSCKAIIIDTLLEAASPITKEDISKEILALFHVLVSSDRLEQILSALITEHIIIVDENEYAQIEPTHRASFISARQSESALRNKAIESWISFVRSSTEVSEDMENALAQSLPVFLRTLFVRHGVKSYEMLSSISDDYSVDIKKIADEVAKQNSIYQNEVRQFLPTVFQCLQDNDVNEYLIHSIKKAVGYISEVISDESLEYLSSGLNELTLYLDTNILYRLLHIQGDERYESIKETIDFCKKNNVKLKISAVTKREFSARLDYDAKVLQNNPVRTDLVRAGYKYRTAENYVSTFWTQTQRSGVSVDDFIQYFKNFDVLLEEEGIEVEEIEVDEEALLVNAKAIYEKLSLRDAHYGKNDTTLWHDAYSMAYVRKMQKVDAKNAIDTGCLFLTTDQSIIAMQREDTDFQNQPIVVLAPSQLLQMFGFTKPDCGYEETFIKFFASSSLGVSFSYNNDDIQEILSRISHYQGVSVTIAERILARELLDDRYLRSTSEEDREEIIFQRVSEEILSELKLTKEQVERLQVDGEKQAQELKEANELIKQNEERFHSEIEYLKDQVTTAERRKNEEVTARKQAEKKMTRADEKSTAQEDFYIEGKMKKWRTNRIMVFWIGLILSVGVIALSIYFCIVLNSGYLGLLGLLVPTGACMKLGAKAFSFTERSKARDEALKEYRLEIDKRAKE